MSHKVNMHWQQGESAARQRDWAGAIQAFTAALYGDPSHVPSLLGMSSAHARLGNHRYSRNYAVAAYEAKPSLAPLIFAVAQRLRFFNEYEALTSCLSWTPFLRSAPPQALAEAAVSLSTIGANVQACELIDRALRIDPKHAPSLYFRGNLHTFSGDFGSAEKCYEAALSADPGMFQAAWMRAGLRKQTRESNHIEELRRQLQKATPGRRGVAYLAYALHKEFHDLGEYDLAWEALERGCRAERELIGYDPAPVNRLFDALEETCTADFVLNQSSVRHDATPIFIIGMFRSGTSLLERMLAGHSSVTDGGETLAFSEQLKYSTNHSCSGVLDAEIVNKLKEADFEEIGVLYGKPLHWLAKGRPFVTEKLPANFLNLAFIAKAIPQARFIHLVRDPMDTCFANLRTLFSEVAAYSYSQADMGEYFLRYRRLMQHWRNIMPDRVLDVHYVDLVNDPEREMRRVADYCGLRFQSQMLDLGRRGGAVVTASATQVRQGIVKDRGGAWRPYAVHLDALSKLVGSLD